MKRVGEITQPTYDEFRGVLRRDMPDLAAVEQHIIGAIADQHIELEYDGLRGQPAVPADRNQRSREAQRIKSRLENEVAIAFREFGPFQSIRSKTQFFGYKFSWFDVGHPEFRALVTLVGKAGTLTVLVGNGEARGYQVLHVSA